jgi:hypothetical protein
MAGKRGRPPKDSSDIELIGAVRAAKARGLTVTEACLKIANGWSESERSRRGYDAYSEECAAQIERRYAQFQREYFQWEPWGHPRLMAMRRLLGMPPTWVRRKVSAFILLTGRPHKKHKT